MATSIEGRMGLPRAVAMELVGAIHEPQVNLQLAAQPTPTIRRAGVGSGAEPEGVRGGRREWVGGR